MSIIGFYSGTIGKILFASSSTSVFLDIYNFNYILIAIAIGSIFLIATIRSYVIALFAVFTSILVLDAARVFGATFNLPVFTLPFNVITLSFLYALRTVSYPYITTIIRSRPEDHAEEFFTRQKRNPELGPLLNLPFAGEWCVWQGFDGPWTHQGNDQYAYDFLIAVKGKTYNNDGSELTDYYAYQKPVLSPCKGRVLKVITNLEDNPPKITDAGNNWGNCIVIDSLNGYFVEISHFAKHSIKVEEGEWLEVGTPLGQCGNSGYSPQPHIHIQVQELPALGARTIPFAFKSYESQESFSTHGLPRQGDTISTVYPERDLEFITALCVGRAFNYLVTEGSKKKEIEMTVAMQEGGETYLKTKHGKLFFAKDENAFYFYRIEGRDRYLKYFLICAPKFPLSYKQGMCWHDVIPRSLLVKRFKRSFYQFMQTIYPDLNAVNYRGEWAKKYHFKCEVNGHAKGEVQFNKDCGIEKLAFENINFELVTKMDENI